MLGVLGDKDVGVAYPLLTTVAVISLEVAVAVQVVVGAVVLLELGILGLLR